MFGLGGYIYNHCLCIKFDSIFTKFYNLFSNLSGQVIHQATGRVVSTKVLGTLTGLKVDLFISDTVSLNFQLYSFTQLWIYYSW